MVCFLQISDSLSQEAVFASGKTNSDKEDKTMWKTLWSIGIVAVVGATLFLTPATSEAQRRGGRGWDGGRGWSGRGWGGVNVGVGVGYPAYYGGGYYRGYYPRYYNTYDGYPIYSD